MVEAALLLALDACAVAGSLLDSAVTLTLAHADPQRLVGRALICTSPSAPRPVRLAAVRLLSALAALQPHGALLYAGYPPAEVVQICAG